MAWPGHNAESVLQTKLTHNPRMHRHHARAKTSKEQSLFQTEGRAQLKPLLLGSVSALSARRCPQAARPLPPHRIRAPDEHRTNNWQRPSGQAARRLRERAASLVGRFECAHISPASARAPGWPAPHLRGQVACMAAYLSHRPERGHASGRTLLGGVLPDGEPPEAGGGERAAGGRPARGAGVQRGACGQLGAAGGGGGGHGAVALILGWATGDDDSTSPAALG